MIAVLAMALIFAALACLALGTARGDLERTKVEAASARKREHVLALWLWRMTNKPEGAAAVWVAERARRARREQRLLRWARTEEVGTPDEMQRLAGRYAASCTDGVSDEPLGLEESGQ